MARFFCRWRTVLICVCTPCIAFVLLLAYVTLILCLAIHGREGSPLPLHFVAQGTFSNGNFAPLPKTFWQLGQHVDGLWNRLQRTVDHHFNPILRPDYVRAGSGNDTSYESLLERGFSEVVGLDGVKESFDGLSRQTQEFLSHMHRRDYPALIQPDGVCGAGAKDERKAPLLLLAIKSMELNFRNRQAIRRTWGQAGRVAGQWRNGKGGGGGGAYVRRVFLLGNGRNESAGGSLSELLQTESDRYGDILQWDFRDTFFNLTVKDVLFWGWFSRSCNRTLFVFKGDDDVFVNTPRMVTYLQEQLKKPRARETIGDFMVGDVIAEGLPNRVNKSKYFIPDGFYKGLYPAYAGGGGVVYSSRLTRRLLHVSKRVHLFPIDDVYVGMCMVRLNAQPVHHPAFLTFDFPKKEEEQLCAYHTILLVHKRSPAQVVDLWDDLKMTRAQCWDVPLRGANKPEL
ncbi:N-acetyllactosaminide beta-1,3-N-acetylglucosaminyltransferase 2 [Clinocottus analis]|uniref:N-acetyllactosaminide beta-1,3-N-acetylglucosaminyltransferase 2 n=1 Tax=Clinocottus analis TaxID=304258 RepID=UPI0035BF9B1A